MKSIYLAAAAAFVIAAPVGATTLDGNLDASYGAAKSTVVGEANTYSIYLTTDANSVFGFLQATTNVHNSALPFANLYFDLDRPNGNGSDLGFEITNRDAFAFGGDPNHPTTAPVGTDKLDFAWSADGTGLEFRLDNSLFTGAIPGVLYEFGADQQFATIGSTLVLRTSQSFNYGFAGPGTGDDRLGTVTLGANVDAAVPEPATWGLMIAGFGLVGGAMRRRRTSVAFA